MQPSHLRINGPRKNRQEPRAMNSSPTIVTRIKCLVPSVLFSSDLHRHSLILGLTNAPKPKAANTTPEQIATTPRMGLLVTCGLVKIRIRRTTSTAATAATRREIGVACHTLFIFMLSRSSQILLSAQRPPSPCSTRMGAHRCKARLAVPWVRFVSPDPVFLRGRPPPGSRSHASGRRIGG